jgi:hypothetical protein
MGRTVSPARRARETYGARPRRMKLRLAMKLVGAILITAATLLAWPRADAAPTTLPSPITYTDGAVAQANPECGVGDLCGTIALPDGDNVRIYNRGAKKCGAYTLELVTLHGDAVVLRSEVVTSTRPGRNRTCPQFANTYVTLDSGEIRMGIFLARDGSLLVEFLPGTR